MTSVGDTVVQKKSGNLGALLRWGFAAVMLYLVFKSGKLSPKDLAWLVQSPTLALAFLGSFLFCHFMSFLRWRSLLAALKLQLSVWTVVKLGMTGAFFSTILPGTIGGDLVKAVFVARRFPKSEGRAVASLLIDRLSGLLAVLLLGSFAFLAGWTRIRAIPGDQAALVRAFGMLLTMVGLSMALLLLLFPVIAKRLPRELPKWTRKIPKVHLVDQFYEATLDYQQNPFAIWKALGISALIQGANMFCYWLIASRIHGPSPWGGIGASEFVLSTVLGLCAMQIPLAPMGLGVGQFAFSSIFLALGAPNAQFGTSLVTSAQVIQLTSNLFGVGFFATYRHEVEASHATIPVLEAGSISEAGKS